MRRIAEFLLIVAAVLAVQYAVASYDESSMGLTVYKIAESFLSTFSSALTLLLSSWVAYRITYSKQQQDNIARRKENVMAFYNAMSTPEFANTRREVKKIIESYLRHPSQSFKKFHSELASQDKACLSSLMLVFRKLQLGLDNCYFELSAVSNCFGDEIVIWHDGCLKEALKEVDWPSALALRNLCKLVKEVTPQDVLVLWEDEMRQFKADLRLDA